MLLYGYGAYETSLDPYFSIARLSLLDRGAAFAIAHVRGGGEMGRRWYDDGKLLHKQNTFSDFVACARHLVDTGWTTRRPGCGRGRQRRRPADRGGRQPGTRGVRRLRRRACRSWTSSRPCSTRRCPLTVTEYDEWGNPEADPAVYDYIAAYAPYDNVTAQAYPPILAETSLNDTRVLYVEPAKWVARLRAAAPETDVLLRTEMSAGHGGVSGRYKAWHDRAFSLAWILDRMGLA